MTILLTLLLLAAAPAEAQTIKVYLQAQPSEDGFIDAGTKRRQDSARDLMRALEKDSSLLLVEDDRETDVLLTVLESREGQSGEMRIEVREDWLGQRADARPKRAYQVEVELTFGRVRKMFEGRSVGNPPTWTAAANHAARQIRAWLRDNRQQLCQRSARSCAY